MVKLTYAFIFETHRMRDSFIRYTIDYFRPKFNKNSYTLDLLNNQRWILITGQDEYKIERLQGLELQGVEFIGDIDERVRTFAFSRIRN